MLYKGGDVKNILFGGLIENIIKVLCYFYESTYLKYYFKKGS